MQRISELAQARNLLQALRLISLHPTLRTFPAEAIYTSAVLSKRQV